MIQRNAKLDYFGIRKTYLINYVNYIDINYIDIIIIF
jgi:hypothetical protein